MKNKNKLNIQYIKNIFKENRYLRLNYKDKSKVFISKNSLTLIEEKDNITLLKLIVIIKIIFGTGDQW